MLLYRSLYMHVISNFYVIVGPDPYLLVDAYFFFTIILSPRIGVCTCAWLIDHIRSHQ